LEVGEFGKIANKGVTLFGRSCLSSLNEKHQRVAILNCITTPLFRRPDFNYKKDGSRFRPSSSATFLDRVSHYRDALAIPSWFSAFVTWCSFSPMFIVPMKLGSDEECGETSTGVPTNLAFLVDELILTNIIRSTPQTALHIPD
jgi:hypothetical protein